MINVFRSAYFVQGTLERRRNRPEAAEANFMEAQNMWFKGDQTRFHPFNAGCIYKMGVVCLDQGKVEIAMYVSIPSLLSSLYLFLQLSNPSIHPSPVFQPYTLCSSEFINYQHVLSSTHLRDALEITKFHSDAMPVEPARGLFKLSEALVQNSSTNEGGDDGSEKEAQHLRDEAEKYLLRRDKSATQFGKEDAYDRWVPIFWR
jgi:hypothetical protein